MMQITITLQITRFKNPLTRQPVERKILKILRSNVSYSANLKVLFKRKIIKILTIWFK